MAQDRIRASGTKGFQKSEVEVVVRGPTGKSRQILFAEVQNLKKDRRHKKRPEYVTFMSLSQHPRCDLTYNVATDRYSITFHSGFHHGYVVLDDLGEAALAAVLYSLTSRSRGFSSNKLDPPYNRLPIITKYFLQQFKKKIRAARKHWHKSAKAHRAHRGRSK